MTAPKFVIGSAERVIKSAIVTGQVDPLFMVAKVVRCPIHVDTKLAVRSREYPDSLVENRPAAQDRGLHWRRAET